MKLGFTGTRKGFTSHQAAEFRHLLDAFSPDEFHHGDCIGADAMAAAIVAARCPDCKIIVHPPVDETHRAHFDGHVILPPKTHFARNRDIVNETDGIIGIVPEMERLERGGTWYTLAFAQKRGKPLSIIWPDGAVSGWQDWSPSIGPPLAS